MWKNYYKEHFIKQYAELTEKSIKFQNLQSFNLSDNSKIAIAEMYKAFFDLSYKIIKLFLIHNIIFDSNNITLIKRAYSLNIIENGYFWTELYYLLQDYINTKDSKSINNIFHLYIKNGFEEFDKLKTYFEKELEEELKEIV